MITVQIPDTLARRLEHIAQHEQRSLEEIVIDILDRYSSPSTLTLEQFAFMREHHEEIMRAIVDQKRAVISGTTVTNEASVIDKLISSAHYKELFGTMIWDEAIDRYEDTPGYDNRLWIELHQQLQRDLESGVIQKAARKQTTGKKVGLSLEEFRRRLDAE